MLWGWMVMATCSKGIPNNHWASMTSSPLFIRVAESIEILGPIFQFGCRRASSRVIRSICSGERSQKGPPEAVKMIRLTESRRCPWST